MKKRNRLASFSRRRRTVKETTRPRSNPPLDVDLKEYIIPGFVAYAGARFVTRIVNTLMSKRFPRLGKHAAVLSAGAAFGGVWLLAHRFEATKRYHTPAVVGSAIAAIQTAVQAYVPKYGWLVGDTFGTETAKQQPALSAATQTLESRVGGGDDENDDLLLGDGGSLGNGGMTDSELDALVAEYE